MLQPVRQLPTLQHSTRRTNGSLMNPQGTSLFLGRLNSGPHSRSLTTCNAACAVPSVRDHHESCSKAAYMHSVEAHRSM